MVKVGDDLHGNVRLARTWRADHESEAALHARANRLNLSGREGNSVSIATEIKEVHVCMKIQCKLCGREYQSDYAKVM